MKDKKGFLKECLITTQCVGYELNNLLVSVIEPKSVSSRISALIYLDGTIFAHSEGFPELFKLNSYKVEKSNIKEFINYFNIESLSTVQPFLIHDMNIKALLSFKILEYLNIQCVLLTCFTDSHEIDKIRSNDSNAKQRKKLIKKKHFPKSELVDFAVNRSYNLDRIKQKDGKDKVVENQKVEEKETNALTNSSKHGFINSFECKYISKVLKLFSYLKLILILLVSNI